MKTQAVIPTAGTGVRMNSSVAKPFIQVLGKPLFLYCLLTLDRCPEIDSIILVGEEGRLEELKDSVQKAGIVKVKKVISGGARRCDSVYNGIQALDGDTECVLIHDSARPLLKQETVKDLMSAARTHTAISLGVPVKPTLKHIDPNTNIIKKTIDRSGVWEAQTPQVFRKDLILRAHEQNKATTPTDDASLVEQLGEDVVMVMGRYDNIKVTTEEDIRIMEALIV